MSWTVHSTVDEPVELLCAFTAHYLEAGAAEVHLCLDRRNEDVMDLLSPFPQVRLTTCDSDYWARTPVRKRPIGQADRQTINLRRAYSESRHDWLLFCDADEFLQISRGLGSMDTLLATFDQDVRFYTFPVAERVYIEGVPAQTVFDGFYRCRSKKIQEIGPSVYGEDWKFFSRGLLQDGPGKSVMRTGESLDVSIHAPRDKRNSSPKGTSDYMAALNASYLVHYDGLTPLHWALKLARWYKSMIDLLGNDVTEIRKRRTTGRNSQAEELHRKRADPEALRNMTRLQFLSRSQYDLLAEAGGVADINPNIGASTRRVFPSLDFDFAQRTFDARLRSLHEDFIISSGFKYEAIQQ